MVFDLDSTLFNVSPRITQIMQDFFHSSEAIKYQHHKGKLKNLVHIPKDWGIENSLKSVGIIADQNDTLYKDIKKFWNTHFFSNNYLKYDTPYEAAKEFVDKLHNLGAHIIYLTGRDQHRFGQGTIDSLNQWKFPMNEATTTVLLKEHQEREDHIFKLEQFIELDKKFDHTWLFENEPVNINHILLHSPHAQFVFFDSLHSGREEVSDNSDQLVGKIISFKHN